MGIHVDNPGIAVSSLGGRLRLTVPASLDGVDLAMDTARAFFARARGQANLFPVLTALREALVNAAAHGCGLDSSLTFDCQLAVEGGQAVVTIADPGPGFDWKAAVCRDPEPGAVSGRGLCMMRHYSQGMAHNERGNEVTLTIELDARSKP